MLKPIRKTANGTEYWDTEAKKIIIGSSDLAKDQEKQTDSPIDEMNVEQLLEFAEKNNIEVPGNMSKEETIRKHIAEQLAAADE